jgi:hypothetical protein
MLQTVWFFLDLEKQTNIKFLFQDWKLQWNFGRTRKRILVNAYLFEFLFEFPILTYPILP